VKDRSIPPPQVDGALGLLEVRKDRSVHLVPAVAVFLAQTVTGAAVHLDAAGVEAVLEASPAAASQVVVAGVAEAVDKIETLKPRRGPSGPLLFYPLTCGMAPSG
jgi:hypothetical protein